MFFFFQNGSFDFQGYASFLFVAFFAFAYHEYAHAIVADRLGDPTPRSHGRITLNPFPHIDRLGFILLAIVGFGFATTPVNPSMLRGNPRQSYAIVAIAGPIANILMAIGFSLVIRLVDVTVGMQALPGWGADFLIIGIWLNLLLFAFNLMPVPPLDGFSILTGILPAELAYRLMPLRQYGFAIFLVIFFLLPRLGLDIFGWVFAFVQRTLLPFLI